MIYCALPWGPKGVCTVDRSIGINSKHPLTTQRDPGTVQWTNAKPKTPSIYQSGPTNQCGLLWEKALLMWQTVHFHYHTTILAFWEAAVILSIDQITGKDQITMS